MSRANVELLRRAWETWVRRDPAGLEYMDEHIVFEVAPEVSPEPGTYRGRAGYRQLIRAWGEVWEEWALEPVEFIDADGDKVIVRVRGQVKAKHSGLPATNENFYVYTVRNDRIARIQQFQTRDDALAAAGEPVTGGGARFESGVQDWFTSYLDRFAAAAAGDDPDPEPLLRFYNVPLILVTSAAFVTLATREDVAARVRQELETMQAAGYGSAQVHRSDWKLVNERGATHDLTVSRLDRDGNELQRLRVVYFVARPGEAWRIVAMALNRAER